MKTIKPGAWALPFALAAALIASQAAAEEVDSKSVKELTAFGQKIDKVSASADSGRVTSKIVDQWKGTKFQFDPASAPRELTAQDVQNLRQRRLGNGEISILLALAAKQPDPATARPFFEIVARREAGTGLGNLAKQLGYRSLGEVMKSVKATDKSVEQVALSGRSEKGEKPGKVDKPEKPDRPEKPERSVKPERVERIEKSGR